MTQDRIKALEDALRTKAAMIELGEKIAWGSDVALMREAADALAASQPAQPVAVKVKSLVWCYDGHGAWSSGEYDVWDEFGKYQVYYWSIVCGEPHPTAEAAQAAAQADYEARIMAALDVHPLTVQDAARVLLISSDRGVCVGGRWDGWMMIRHPDGHWVSHHKLDAVDPRTEMTDALRAIAEGRA